MTSIAEMISDAAVQAGIDPNLALEVATQESGLNQSAVSKSGAIGVFQLEPATAAGLGVDPTNLEQNIRGGVSYLSQMLTQFGGDTAAALAAYNAGPGAVAKAQAAYGENYLSALPAETQNYVPTILGNLGTQYQVGVGLPTDSGQIGAAVAQIETWTGVSSANWALLGLIAMGVYLAYDVLTD